MKQRGSWHGRGNSPLLTLNSSTKFKKKHLRLADMGKQGNTSKRVSGLFIYLFFCWPRPKYFLPNFAITVVCCATSKSFQFRGCTIPRSGEARFIKLLWLDGALSSASSSLASCVWWEKPKKGIRFLLLPLDRTRVASLSSGRAVCQIAGEKPASWVTSQISKLSKKNWECKLQKHGSKALLSHARSAIFWPWNIPLGNAVSHNDALLLAWWHQWRYAICAYRTADADPVGQVYVRKGGSSLCLSCCCCCCGCCLLLQLHFALHSKFWPWRRWEKREGWMIVRDPGKNRGFFSSPNTKNNLFFVEKCSRNRVILTAWKKQHSKDWFCNTFSVCFMSYTTAQHLQ